MTTEAHEPVHYGVVEAALNGDGEWFDMYQHLSEVGGVRSTESMVLAAIMGARYPKLHDNDMTTDAPDLAAA